VAGRSMLRSSVTAVRAVAGSLPPLAPGEPERGEPEPPGLGEPEREPGRGELGRDPDRWPSSRLPSYAVRRLVVDRPPWERPPERADRVALPEDEVSPLEEPLPVVWRGLSRLALFFAAPAMVMM
jgi:hypothetical protein